MKGHVNAPVNDRPEPTRSTTLVSRRNSQNSPKEPNSSGEKSLPSPPCQRVATAWTADTLNLAAAAHRLRHRQDQENQLGYKGRDDITRGPKHENELDVLAKAANHTVEHRHIDMNEPQRLLRRGYFFFNWRKSKQLKLCPSPHHCLAKNHHHAE